MSKNITYELVLAATKSEKDKEVLLKYVDQFIRLFLKYRHNRWSLAKHPYIYDYLNMFLTGMWKNTATYLKVDNIPGCMLHNFKFGAWSNLVYHKKYQPKIRLHEDHIDDIDLEKTFSNNDYWQEAELYLNADFLISQLKKPSYISKEEWREIKSETKAMLKVAKSGGDFKRQVRPYTDVLVRNISRSILDRSFDEAL